VRVLLLNPPSPERLGAPLLGLQHVAAALLRAGHEVRVIDAAARHFEHGAAWIAGQVLDFRPRFVGVALFTRWVWHAYRLLPGLRETGALLVAGGAHATVLPQETLEQGFDVALTGEAEHSVVALAAALEGGTAPAAVPGAWVREPGGRIVRGAPGGFIEDLDALAPPQLAQALFDPRWYDASGRSATPGGLLTSRGCPARCTFCANVVTGRGFRMHGIERVLADLEHAHAASGQTFFPFWDDALSAKIPRLTALCEAFEHRLSFPLRFSAITRAGAVTPALLKAMKRAGLVHVNFGVESGDDEVLRVIGKGLHTAQVVRALEWARAEGLATACNFMLGFPEDTPATLERVPACGRRRVVGLAAAAPLRAGRRRARGRTGHAARRGAALAWRHARAGRRAAGQRGHAASRVSEPAAARTAAVDRPALRAGLIGAGAAGASCASAAPGPRNMAAKAARARASPGRARSRSAGCSCAARCNASTSRSRTSSGCRPIVTCSEPASPATGVCTQPRGRYSASPARSSTSRAGPSAASSTPRSCQGSGSAIGPSYSRQCLLPSSCTKIVSSVSKWAA
jgi:hypothetical protein